MKVLWDIVVSAVISLEFLAVCAVTVLTFWFPELLSNAGAGVKSHKEAFQWLSIACVGALIFSLRCGHEILVPKHEHSGILADWPGFYMLKNRTLIAVCYVVAGTCVALALWTLGADLSDAKISAVYYAAVSVVMISALSLWYATVQLGIRLRRVQSQNV